MGTLTDTLVQFNLPVARHGPIILISSLKKDQRVCLMNLQLSSLKRKREGVGEGEKERRKGPFSCGR